MTNVRHQRFSAVAGRQRGYVLAGALGVHFRHGGTIDPPLNVRAHVGQQLSLSGNVRDQDREVTVVSIKISDGTVVSFHEVCLAGQQVASLFLLHLNHGTFQLGKELENLG